MGWQVKSAKSGQLREAPLPRDASIYLLRERLQQLETVSRKARSVASRYNRKCDALRARAGRQAEQIEKLRAVATDYRRNLPVNRYLEFARAVYEAAERLRADVHVAHGVQALPAADIVARSVGGRVFCDAIEIPSFASRSIVTWDAVNLAFLDLAFESYLRRCDGILTVGWALATELKRFGPPVHVIPNYRFAERLTPSNQLRERCGLGPGRQLVLAISTIASGLETVVEALALLPAHVHLAVVGRIVPGAYLEQIQGLVRAHKLERRFHLFDQVPYDQLTATASGADVGLIVLDPAIPNHKLSLPNRVFDYMASALPVCSPDIADISRILRDYDMGVMVNQLDAAGWAGAITSALACKEEMRANALAASREMVWEMLEEPLYEALGQPARVAYFGNVDLTKNNRTMRMATSLAKRGTAVTICTYGEAPLGAAHENISFHMLRRGHGGPRPP
jgi:glycosyltransferase involved in cell wall biosynthesis